MHKIFANFRKSSKGGKLTERDVRTDIKEADEGTKKRTRRKAK